MIIIKTTKLSHIGYEDVNNAINRVIDKRLKYEDVIFACIGTDRSTGDSLGPLVGSLLEQAGFTNVLGTIDNPLHAVNLEDRLRSIDKSKTVIAIDCSLGDAHHIETFSVYEGFLRPGAGVGKVLSSVGDYSITGCVNIGGYMEYFVLQNTRLHVVMKMANMIADSLIHRFGKEKKRNKKKQLVSS